MFQIRSYIHSPCAHLRASRIAVSRRCCLSYNYGSTLHCSLCFRSSLSSLPEPLHLQFACSRSFLCLYRLYLLRMFVGEDADLETGDILRRFYRVIPTSVRPPCRSIPVSRPLFYILSNPHNLCHVVLSCMWAPVSNRTSQCAVDQSHLFPNSISQRRCGRARSIFIRGLP